MPFCGLSTARTPAIKTLSEQITAPLQTHITLETIHAIADAFLRLAICARTEGVITNEQLTGIRAEIGRQLAVATSHKFTALEKQILEILGRHADPITCGTITAHCAALQSSVSNALSSLRKKNAVSFEVRKHAGYYALARSASQSSTQQITVAAGALIAHPILGPSHRPYRQPTLTRRTRR